MSAVSQTQTSMADFYINRKLHLRDRLILDEEILGLGGVVVILAEPGAGKTEVLNFVATQSRVDRQRASLFAHLPTNPCSILIIDALDEVARIDESSTNATIVKARSTGADTIVLSSRSYLWDEARTHFVRECFGREPTLLRLEPFDEDEQRKLFENYLPQESFSSFVAEAGRFELIPLLGNPQFLKLFADAFVEGGHVFSSKRKIYADAVKRLATENNQTAAIRDRPDIARITAIAGELFCKLLLSGAAGISVQESVDDGEYPYIASFNSDSIISAHALDSRLFKPTSFVSKHEPVHRIVAEYCAAEYLTRLISDPTNSLTMKRCLAVIAPNGAVRDELKGLLGWIATLGDRATQEAVIDVDPYSVFANGDPSQLLGSSKRRVISGLAVLAKVDPYFRRMDAWRRFSVAGFFSDEVVEQVRPLLTSSIGDSHLRGLMLELLEGSEASKGLRKELRGILLDGEAKSADREQAFACLRAISDEGDAEDFDSLTEEKSYDSLRIASEAIIEYGDARYGLDRAKRLLKYLASLYPRDELRERPIVSRYFIRRLVSSLNGIIIPRLLDSLSDDMTCSCGATRPHRCKCRGGRSKILSFLMDRYFDTVIGPVDPRQIARWTRQMHFRSFADGKGRAAIEFLQLNDSLRREVQFQTFAKVNTEADIHQAVLDFYMSQGQSYSGLSIRNGDIEAIVNRAHSSGNVHLWQQFIRHHSPYSEQRGVDRLRLLMKSQARQSPELHRIWAREEKRFKEAHARDRIGRGWSRKRIARVEADQKETQLESLRNNRELVQAGKHWGWLKFFAQQYLHDPEKLIGIVDDPQLPETALRNSFEFLAPHIPSLQALAKIRGGNAVTMVLHAASLATFRKNGVLDGLPIDIIKAVKIDGPGGNGYAEGERERFEDEVDRLIFRSDADIIAFAKDFLESQLAEPGESFTRAEIIDHGDHFARVKGRLALEWLTRYPDMPSTSRSSLFRIAAVNGDRAELNALIDKRAKEVPLAKADERWFWLLRHFFFILPTSESFWAEFTQDSKSILAIEDHAGNLSRHDSQGWPELNSRQIYRVLNTFVDVWPKVPLPDMWGTGDPDDERAYRFLRELVFSLRNDSPDAAIEVIDLLLEDTRFDEFHEALKSEKASTLRKLALSGYQPPSIGLIVGLLNNLRIASVEDMRALLVELLEEVQHRIKGAATNPIDVFYSGGKRVDENTSRNRIVEMLEFRLNALNANVVIEHQMADAKRCDFTASTTISGVPRILVVEVKGQWNGELYLAAAKQLGERYTIYPGAADQGVYLVLWFGDGETIAGRKNQSIQTADQLRIDITGKLSEALKHRIDVFVLDLSKGR